jgi:hypothetical protein
MTSLFLSPCHAPVPRFSSDIRICCSSFWCYDDLMTRGKLAAIFFLAEIGLRVRQMGDLKMGNFALFFTPPPWHCSSRISIVQVAAVQKLSIWGICTNYLRRLEPHMKSRALTGFEYAVDFRRSCCNLWLTSALISQNIDFSPDNSVSNLHSHMISTFYMRNTGQRLHKSTEKRRKLELWMENRINIQMLLLSPCLSAEIDADHVMIKTRSAHYDKRFECVKRQVACKLDTGGRGSAQSWWTENTKSNFASNLTNQ